MDDLEPSIEYSDTGYPVAEPVPIFAISLRPPNKIRLINVGPDLVRAIQVCQNDNNYLIFLIADATFDINYHLILMVIFF